MGTKKATPRGGFSRAVNCAYLSLEAIFTPAAAGFSGAFSAEAELLFEQHAALSVDAVPLSVQAALSVDADAELLFEQHAALSVDAEALSVQAALSVDAEAEPLFEQHAALSVDAEALSVHAALSAEADLVHDALLSAFSTLALVSAEEEPEHCANDALAPKTIRPKIKRSCFITIRFKEFSELKIRKSLATCCPDWHFLAKSITFCTSA